MDESLWIPEPNCGCHIWLGNIDKDGYGHIGSNVVKRAHRESWIERNGPIPKGMSILHRCDVRCCVNADHIYPGTQKQNIADMDKRRRRRPPPVQCKRGHVFEEVGFYEYSGSRHCKECLRIRNKRNRHHG